MADEEFTTGGGFQAVVRRGVFKSQAEAKVAANKKTVHNMTRAVERSELAMAMRKAEAAEFKKYLSDAKKLLKHSEETYADEIKAAVKAKVEKAAE